MIIALAQNATAKVLIFGISLVRDAQEEDGLRRRRAMIKPYYKHLSNVNVVEVEDYGLIDLNTTNRDS